MRTRLGPFFNKHVALDVLEKVQASGHTDAFITNYLGDGSIMPDDVRKTKDTSAHTAGQQYDIENFDVRTLKEWELLTPEQQANLVYLDGALHVKNGYDFAPLYEIIAKK